MIVYSEDKQVFMQDVSTGYIQDKIVNALQNKLGHSVSPNEINAFQNSMMFMHHVLNDSQIPADSKVAIEYKIPQTAKRVDFILTGKSIENKSAAIIVELKQWSKSDMTEMDGIVSTFVGGTTRNVSHPSYQAWSYATLLEDYNETVQKQEIDLIPCAYMHNYPNDGVINNEFYQPYIEKAPLFLKNDALKLQKFIKEYIHYGDDADIMFQIDHGKIRPSKSLTDNLVSLLQGNKEFIMIDDQKVVYEKAIELAQKANSKDKKVLIVEGGPGTGKSVIAINLLVELTKLGLVSQYVTKNAAPRAIYENKLTGTLSKSRISNLFSGSGAYTNTEPNLFDVLIVDEAHRLNAKSGLFQNLGENQIMEIIRASKFSIFFLDEDQKVTLNDIGEIDEIIKYAEDFDAEVLVTNLSSQFRCNGSDGFLAWLDNTLQIHETANDFLDGIDYDFRIVDSPTKLKELIFEKNNENKARLVAGYCWDWKSKNTRDESVKDIILENGDFAMRWNLTTYGNLWLSDQNSVSEVGCIHTCQGLELDYVGVIVGSDMVARGEKIITDASKRSKQDASLKGFKRLLQVAPVDGQYKLDKRIKNTYRTLMTRGMKGCYVYFVDKETEDYFRSRLSQNKIKNR